MIVDSSPQQPRSYKFGPYPQYAWDFPEEIPEKFRETPWKLSDSKPPVPMKSGQTAAPNRKLQIATLRFGTKPPTSGILEEIPSRISSCGAQERKR